MAISFAALLIVLIALPFAGSCLAALHRQSVSTPVFVGMLAATSVGVFLIPMLCVFWESLRQAGRNDVPTKSTG
jgi:multidrug efflux pump